MERLLRRQDFLAVARGRSRAAQGAVVQVRKREDDNPPRVGFRAEAASFSIVDDGPPTRHARIAFRASQDTVLTDPDGNSIELVRDPRKRALPSLLEWHGPGGPSGLQNRQGGAALRLEGSIPSPLRRGGFCAADRVAPPRAAHRSGSALSWARR